jgi:hypothetical protein
LISKDKLIGFGFETTTSTGEQFRRELADEMKRWTVVAKSKTR